MPVFVSRFVFGIVLLGVGLFLIPESPEKQDRSAQDQSGKVASVLAAGVKSNIAPLPKDLKILDDISYRSEDDKRCRLDLILSRTSGTQKRPALVFVHGGSWTGNNKAQGYFKTGPLEFARKGFVCVSVNYRLSDEAPFSASLDDVKCAVRWLRAHADKYQIDPNRIGGFGNSAGGPFVSLLGLTDEKAELKESEPWKDYSSKLNAVCIAAAPFDFSEHSAGAESSPMLAELLSTPLERSPESAEKVSPINYVHAEAPPILVMHGTRDRAVRVSQADRFIKALRDAGAKDVTYYRSEVAGHTVFLKMRKETFPLMEEFFTRTLGYHDQMKVAQR